MSAQNGAADSFLLIEEHPTNVSVVSAPGHSLSNPMATTFGRKFAAQPVAPMQWLGNAKQRKAVGIMVNI
jgi:hypothetical protein